MNVICVIGDMVGSRSVQDRGKVHERFQSVLHTINRDHRNHLASPNTITLGDEYQAVYRDADTLFQDFWLILGDLYPVRIRFSVGIGTLGTAINKRQALGMDGPAFHVARAGFDSEFKGSGELFRIRHASEPVPPWIMPSLVLLSHEIRSWEANRFRILLSRLAGHPPKRIAEELGISQTAVYKNIHAGALEPISQMTQEITRWLNEQVRR